jgi:hypothetical protein
VTVIDDDLSRSGSGLMARPGFKRLVAELCAGAVGAVFCIEASRERSKRSPSNDEAQLGRSLLINVLFLIFLFDAACG